MQIIDRYEQSFACTENLNKSILEARHYYIRNRRLIEAIQTKKCRQDDEIAFETKLIRPDGMTVIHNSDLMDHPIISSYDYETDQLYSDAGNLKHRHDFIELGFVAKGTYRVQTDIEKYTFEEGDCFVFNSSIEHKDLVSDTDVFICMIRMTKEYYKESIIYNFDNNILQKFYENILQMNNYSEAIFRIKSKAVLLNNWISYLELVMDEIMGKNHGWKYIAKGYLLRGAEIILSLTPNEVEVYLIKGRNESLFDEIKLYIEEHYAEINVTMLVEQFSYNSDYYNRMFKKNSGITLREYIQEIKVKKAIELIKTSNLSMEEVAIRVGYANKTSFYKIFKSYSGLTPMEYKKRFEKN